MRVSNKVIKRRAIYGYVIPLEDTFLLVTFNRELFVWN